MTIKRQYSLPNCTLTLEGMSSDTSTQLNARPLLSILVNAECQFNHTSQLLTGGRDFFTSLVKAVSAYGQEFLSGIRHPQAHQDEGEIINLETVPEKKLHRLTWYPNPEEDPNGVANTSLTNPVQVDLTTVQLFDLVEAVDQFLADSRTLPELVVPLQPINKRYRTAEVPVAQRALPPALGIGSLALAAAAFFLIPVPEEVQQPQPTTQEAPSSEVETESDEDSGENSPEGMTDSPNNDDEDDVELETQSSDDPTEEDDANDLEGEVDEEESDEQSTNSLEEEVDGDDLEVGSDPEEPSADSLDSPDEKIAENNPASEQQSANLNSGNKNRVSNQRASASASEKPSSGNRSNRPQMASAPRNNVNVSSAEIENILASASQISDPNDLYYIQKYVRNQISDAWEQSGEFNGRLIYRVRATQDGTIFDYQPVGATPVSADSLTPLPDLSYQSTNSDLGNQEEIAEFRVAFTSNGVVEISPWRGLRNQPNFDSDIRNSDQLQELNNALRRRIHGAWDGNVSYSKGLVYRVAVTEDGTIVDYDSINQAAFDYLSQTPLRLLVKPEAAGIGTTESRSVIPQQPLAHFRVVFRPNGILEINSW